MLTPVNSLSTIFALDLFCQGIHCLFDEAVLEVMWGLKNLIKFLVPDEELELTNEDCLQISQGMKLVLDRYGFEVDANLVSSSLPFLCLRWFAPCHVLLHFPIVCALPSSSH
jgi:hypothetical protein